jgi:Zn-dependent protease
MENLSIPSSEPWKDGQHETDQVIFPPKPPEDQPGSKSSTVVKSITSLLLYLAIGYYFFNQNWTLVLILTAVVLFHEMGHFLAMKYYNYSELGIFFIPLVGAYVSGKKQEVSQLQSSIILLAGPVPGIIAGILLQILVPYITQDSSDLALVGQISQILIFLNLLNLLPIYPLDGGQLLNRLFLDNSQLITRIFLLLSIAVMVWFALFGMSSPFYVLLIIPAYLLMRMYTDFQFDKLTSKVESEGIDLTTTYEDISDENYWKIRNILIRQHAAFKDVPTAPPYEYSEKEEQIKSLTQNLLQRTIVQDITLTSKFIIIVIWVSCFIAPFVLKLPLVFRS